MYKRQGPVFANIVLADEVNRATPKTHSALLEAMQEKTVTAGNITYKLPDPFFVLATQNPLELEGTYPLPEAQLDRFIFKLDVKFPSKEELLRIVNITTGTRAVSYTHLFSRRLSSFGISSVGFLSILTDDLFIKNIFPQAMPLHTLFPLRVCIYKMCIRDSGGNVSTNAGGMRAVKYGSTRDYVRAMQVVLPTGEIVRFGSNVTKTSSGYSLSLIHI